MPAIELYQALATRLKAPLPHVLAIDEVESSGLAFWNIGGVPKPAIRHEAHHFGACTRHIYDASHPTIATREWRPELAAKTWAGAWAQHDEAVALDRACADSSASWGRFQVMGFNWRGLHYGSIAEFVLSMSKEEGQIEAFARYIEADPVLQRALIAGNWRVVAARYNGTGAVDAYSAKLAAAAERHGAQAQPQPARVLQIGDKGADVSALQEALLRHGQTVEVDGDFGPATAAAVKAFQAANGLVADGMAGPMTKSWLGLIR